MKIREYFVGGSGNTELLKSAGRVKCSVKARVASNWKVLCPLMCQKVASIRRKSRFAESAAGDSDFVPGHVTLHRITMTGARAMGRLVSFRRPSRHILSLVVPLKFTQIEIR